MVQAAPKEQIMPYSRYAIYYLPSGDPWSAFGASWLGWDAVRGCRVGQPAIDGLADITATPKRYGFHATLKPPFRLAPGVSEARLAAAVGELAEATAPAACDGLKLAPLGRFLALVPRGEDMALGRLAGQVVSTLDRFRAAPNAMERARRQRPGLTERQKALLAVWGYPFVMDQFRFHMTLTGRLAPEVLGMWRERLNTMLPPLPAPFKVHEIALAGERDDGFFEQIAYYPLTG